MTPTDVHVFEFLREAGIGVGVAVPICLVLFAVLRLYVKGELAELKALMQSNLDATTIELRSTHVTLDEFNRFGDANAARQAGIIHQLDKINEKIDMLLMRGYGERP